GDVFAAAAVLAATALPPLPLTYSAYVRGAERLLDAGEQTGADLAYWCEALAGVPDLLELPFDRLPTTPTTPTARPGARGVTAAQVPFAVGPGLTAALAAVAREEGVTPFMVLLAGWQLLLGRYTGAERFLVGAPVALRARAAERGLVGYCVNVLPLVADLSGQPSFRTVLRRVRATCLAAYAHQAVAFERLVEALGPTRAPGLTPLVPVML